MKILLLGNNNGWNLEASYKNAFEMIGCQVEQFDLLERIDRYSKFGKVGRLLNRFISIDSWVKKANRDFVIFVKNFNPDVIISFCNVPVSCGSLAYIKSILDVKIVLVWPDTLLNIKQDVINSANLYDMVACYSKTSMPSFELIGYKNVIWVPLAGDPIMFDSDIIINEDLFCDISFIGGYRPEREMALARIVENFPDKKIKIFSVDWRKNAKNKDLLKYLDNRLFYGSDFSKVLRASKVNINIIDDTNLPAANMRFFEIPMCGGIQIVSRCMEMESIYKHGVSVLYHTTHEEMLINIQTIFDDEKFSAEIRKNALNLTLSEHTYAHRVKQILKELKKI